MLRIIENCQFFECPLTIFTKYPWSKFWLKLFNDNGGSVEKKRKNASVSLKNNDSDLLFLEI